MFCEVFENQLENILVSSICSRRTLTHSMSRLVLAVSTLLALGHAFQTAPTYPIVRSRTRGSPLVLLEKEKVVKTLEQTDLSNFQGKVTPTTTPEAKQEEVSESKKLLQKVKDAGLAGVISYTAWELVFWGISLPVCIFGFQAATGHWPDFSNQDDMAKVGAEAFAFVNLARLAVPLRIGLALATTPWVQANIVDKFNKKEEQ